MGKKYSTDHEGVSIPAQILFDLFYRKSILQEHDNKTERAFILKHISPVTKIIIRPFLN